MMSKLLDLVFGTKKGICVINGNKYEGNSISINGDKVTVDGKVVEEASTRVLDIKVIGEVKELSTVSGDVTVEGDVHNVKTTSGDTYVKGSVIGYCKTTSGDITAKKIAGPCSTVSGDIESLQ